MDELMKETIEYAYSYDPVNSVYFVRRADNLSLEQYIPGGLFSQIAIEKAMQTGEPVIISDVSKTFHFSSDGTRAFIDLNMRTFTSEEEEMVFANIKVDQNVEMQKNDEKIGIQKVLSRFNPFRKKIK